MKLIYGICLEDIYEEETNSVKLSIPHMNLLVELMNPIIISHFMMQGFKEFTCVSLAKKSQDYTTAYNKILYTAVHKLEADWVLLLPINSNTPEDLHKYILQTAIEFKDENKEDENSKLIFGVPQFGVVMVPAMFAKDDSALDFNIMLNEWVDDINNKKKELGITDGQLT